MPERSSSPSFAMPNLANRSLAETVELGQLNSSLTTSPDSISYSKRDLGPPPIDNPSTSRNAILNVLLLVPQL